MNSEFEGTQIINHKSRLHEIGKKAFNYRPRGLKSLKGPGYVIGFTAHKKIKIIYLAKESALDEDISGSCRKHWLCQNLSFDVITLEDSLLPEVMIHSSSLCRQLSFSDSESSCQDLKAGNGSGKGNKHKE